MLKMQRVAVSMAILACCTGPAWADVVIGANFSLSGPAAALGLAFQRALAFAPKEIGGEKVRYIVLDDATDPSTAVRNVRKLVTEDKADIIIGPTNAPAGYAIAPVLAELQVPMISGTPIDLFGKQAEWFGTVLPPNPVWVASLVHDMKAKGVKRVGYIGYTDTWGDIVYNTLLKVAKPAGLEVTSNERFARTDTSVTGQVLKLLSDSPDAVMVGASSSPAVLPNATLLEQGFTGPIYHTPATFVTDFLRLGGSNVEGAYVPTTPLGVASQLPDSNASKKPALALTQEYEAVHGKGSADNQVGEMYDTGIVLQHIVAEALKTAKPGTPEFRNALRERLYQTRELVGVLGVYNFRDGQPYGLDERAALVAQVKGGKWVLIGN